MESAKKIYIFLVVITAVAVLIFAQSIIIPFILAILFWFLIRVIKKILSKIKFVGAIQLVVGNFVEPKLMVNSLNISPLVVFLTLAIWGVMWGVTGMLLSVPIIVILIIVMSEFPSTQPLAILLSQKGEVSNR